MEEIIVICEDSEDGIFTAVYEVYARKYPLETVRIQTGEEGNLRLFARYEKIATDREKAEKVRRTLWKRFGEGACEDISYALSTQDEEKGQAVFETIREGLSGKIKGHLMDALGYCGIRKVFELSRSAHHEKHRWEEFLRFQEMDGGILAARINPKCLILPFLMPHFSDRFPLENFLIYDTVRNLAGIHPAKKEWFLVRECPEDILNSMILSEKEAELREMFAYFCEKAAIESRKNRDLQRQMMPLRFRDFMTEFQKNL